jgi:hypothetical protein
MTTKMRQWKAMMMKAGETMVKKVAGGMTKKIKLMTQPLGK